MSNNLNITFIDEEKVKSVLTWPLVNEMVEQSFRAVSNVSNVATLPCAHQPARNVTLVNKDRSGILYTMPGFIGNYTFREKKFNTLACKLVTSFTENEKKNLPNIMAKILLMDATTGQVVCIMDGTEITAWRTASASIVATKYLYFGRDEIKRKPEKEGTILAIVGCGVQGKIHAIGMCSTFNISKLNLWNRTKSKAENVLKELIDIKHTFLNKDLKITISSSVQDCVNNADIVVTSTNANEPIIHWDMLKPTAHLNGVGVGATHHSELSAETYNNSLLYTDSMQGANSELVAIKDLIVAEVGEVINGTKPAPPSGVTIFQSLGMAVEDASVAQAVFEMIQMTAND